MRAVAVMGKRTIALTTGLVVAVSGVTAMTIARAQSTPTYCCSAASQQCTVANGTNSGKCPNPSGDDAELVFSPSTGGISLTVQRAEPAVGFTGACLVPFSTYAPQLPTVCYSPAGDVKYLSGSTTTAVFPAAKVARSYGAVPAQYDSYQVLETCYPHNADGSCPQPSFAVSHSCCDYGTEMVSTDGQFASGFANFSTQ
jgi:hypothetical protein